MTTLFVSIRWFFFCFIVPGVPGVIGSDMYEIPRLPVQPYVKTKNIPTQFPISGVVSHNMAIPLPVQPSNVFPKNFPTSEFPSDPPKWNPHDSGNNYPSFQGVKTSHPPGRWLHSMIFYNDQLFIWGGIGNSASLLNDLWVFSYGETQWTELERPVNNVASLYEDNTSQTNLAQQGRYIQGAVTPPNIPPPPKMREMPGVPHLRPVETRRPMDPKNYPIRIEEPPPGMRPAGVKDHTTLRSEWNGGQQAKNYEYSPLLSLMPGMSGLPIPGKDLYGPGLRSSFIEIEEKQKKNKNKSTQQSKQKRQRKIKKPSLMDTMKILRYGVREKARLRKLHEHLSNELINDKLNESIGKKLSGTQRKLLVKAPNIMSTLADTMMSPTFSDMWCYNITERQFYSPFPDTKKPRPPARWSHASAVMNKKMIIFGGVSNNLLLLNDTWSYDLKTHDWDRINIKVGRMNSDMILPREGVASSHSCKDRLCIDGDDMWLFGGVGLDYRPLDDLYKLEYSVTNGYKFRDLTRLRENAETPSMVDKKSRAKSGLLRGWPEPRWMASLSCYTVKGKDEGACILFGGCGLDGGPLDDVWMLNLKNQNKPIFSLMLPNVEGAYPPPARWLHSAVMIHTYEGPAMIVHGGASNNILMDDLWFFQVGLSRNEAAESQQDYAWVELYAIGNSPIAREGHTSVAVVNPGVARTAGPLQRVGPGSQFIQLKSTLKNRVIPEWIEPSPDIVQERNERIRSDQTEEGLAFTTEKQFWEKYNSGIRQNSGGNAYLITFGGGAEQGSVGSAQGGEGIFA